MTKTVQTVDQVSRLTPRTKTIQATFQQSKTLTAQRSQTIQTTPNFLIPPFQFGDPSKEPPTIKLKLKQFPSKVPSSKGVGVVETPKGERVGTSSSVRGAVTRGVGLNLNEFVVRGTGAVPTLKEFKSESVKTGTLFSRRRSRRR